MPQNLSHFTWKSEHCHRWEIKLCSFYKWRKCISEMLSGKAKDIGMSVQGPGPYATLPLPVLWVPGSQPGCPFRITQGALKNLRCLSTTPDEIEAVHLWWENLRIWMLLSDFNVQQDLRCAALGLSFDIQSAMKVMTTVVLACIHACVDPPVSQTWRDSTGCPGKTSKAKRGFLFFLIF